ncbi:unnamed protein product [Echinostoma caproni]|uniref:ABC transporter domain-containing protein n=1 Tax=Echinostoma caproni TaxID=27848 RepID=A0A3P8KYK0_9TREM|nr:unnamed protein product [Echinostoma caproni]
MALLLRTAVTERMHNLYFRNKNFFTVNQLMDLDNPDQRLTQDIGTSCTLVSDILPLFLINPILVVVYTYLCVNNFFHTQVRTSAEGAAFLDVGRSEHYFASTALWRMLHAFRVSVNRQPVLYFFTELSAYTGSILNYVAIGIALFGGYFGDPSAAEITNIISQTSFFLLYLINKLTTLVDLANKIAQLVGVGYRVVALEENMLKYKHLTSPAAYAAEKQYLTDWVDVQEIMPALPSTRIDPNLPNVVMQINHITVALPMDRNCELVQDLSITLQLNRSLLITGPSGVGKTALLRVLGKLWPAVPAIGQSNESSFFYRSPRIQQLLVPQRPFVPSAFACPYELFNVLEDELDHETIEYTLSHGSSASFRALYLAYLLLTAAEAPPDVQEDWKKTFHGTEKSPIGDYMEAGYNRYTDNSAVFCGYRVNAYVEAMKLLVEFKLTDSATAKTVTDRLIRLNDLSSNGKRTDVCKLGRFGCNTVVREYDFAGGEWRNSYSPGEMQRVVLASVCYRRPQVAFLDESTSQLSASAECDAYESLRKRNITVISVGHRLSLRQFHSEELIITPANIPINRGGLPPHTVKASGPNWEHIVYDYPEKS